MVRRRVSRMAGYIDRSGEWAIAPSLRTLAFKEGMGGRDGGRWVRPPEGQLVITARSSGDEFSRGMALVRNDQQKTGFIDRTGTLSSTTAYDLAWSCRSGLAIVGEDLPTKGSIASSARRGIRRPNGYEPCPILRRALPARVGQ